MTRVTGFGGAFVRANDPKSLSSWYEKHLGVRIEGGSFSFSNEAARGPIVVAFFARDADYFPFTQHAMLNFQVDDLEGVLADLSERGVSVDPEREDSEYGRFGWFTDPEGNRVELWQPSNSEGSV